MIEQIFLSPQVKRSVIISNKQINFIINFIKLLRSAYFSSQTENFVISPQNKKINFSHSAAFHMKTRVCLKCYVNIVGSGYALAFPNRLQFLNLEVG